MTLAFLFPGQSSRYPAMLERTIAAWPPAAAIVERASAVVGRDLRAGLAPARPDLFVRNRDVQVGVFLTSYLHQRALEESGVSADLSLGLSLGEYNHLVHIGALDFESALQLVDARGDIYDRGPPGMMASVFPLAEEDLMPYLAAAAVHGKIEIANLNSPSQNVIAGETAAVEAAIRLIEDEEPAVQAVVIERRIPMHTSVFKPVAMALAPHLEAAPWRTPSRPYLPNVLADMLPAPPPLEIAALLERHVRSPVLWRRSIDLVAARYKDVRFIEVGPGAVLYNLLQKRWHDRPRFRTDDPDDLAGSLTGGLRERANAA